jgi:predicted nucleic acid-binding protein
MNDRAFYNTNIVVYLYSEDEKPKQEMAYKAVNYNYSLISTQTLNEACNIWHKKYGLHKSIINKYLNEIELVFDEILIIQRKTIDQALNIKERYGFAYFDCLMLASALEGNCNIIFSEDLQDGQTINDTLKIINPFNCWDPFAK